ncbi:unnamed protein product [Brassicogethes aeneus]|uniref:Transcription initiation factor TFIID subunit 12 n=1 Tax=Brassicogethes aeneus TaxID=1431903 RepID=A0A9P0BCF0_BRAAE|nr:unnamed protein product [Brassicogethes aeneus]
MSNMPITNNILPQNIVINQGQLQQHIMTNVNANNGIQQGALHHPNSNMEHSGSPTKNIHNHNNVHHSNNTDHSSGQVFTKQRLQDLVRDTDPSLNLEEEVEEVILSYVDQFVDRCLKGAAMIAKNRRVNTIEVKDVQLFLNRNYNMWTPGFGTDELRPYKRSMTTDAHKQRTALIKKTLKKY